MDEALLRRLVGALVLFGGAFLLTWLLPAPRQPGAAADQTVIAYDLVRPERVRPESMPEVPPEPPPTDVVAEAPEASAAEAPPATGTWRIQIGSFGKPENALAALRRMREAGQPGEIQKLASGKNTIYRVRIGPYYRQEDARAALKVAEATGFRGAQLVEPGAR